VIRYRPALPFAPEPKPDFSGSWRLNLETSTFRGAAPRPLLVRIEHDEPVLTQVMHVVSASGAEQQMTFTYDTSGTESTHAIAGGDLRSRARWKGSELVIESELTTTGGTFRFEDHWSLSADGQTLRMAHVDDALAGQVAVLEKLP
jgi:hypothetical protein